MHWFLDPIRHHYADLDGRATRQEFWMFQLWNALFLFSILAIASFIHGFLLVFGIPFLAFPFSILFLMYLFYIASPSIAISVRRLHDIDQTGWLVLLGLIPHFGCIALFVFYCLPGEKKKNRYGSPSRTSTETD